ncbi:MAG: tRNA uridine-5-carboxymethylaminomethyl(34) synthesis GTPase MnmE [Rickettsiales bacterium]
MTTIYAPATPPGRSAVAIIRISGPESKSLFSFFGLPLPTPRIATLATLRNPETKEILDNALLFWFPAPRSYTGEDTIELHLHGGRAIREEILSLLSGISEFRLAEPGEFSKQAFFNGKMDLLQAEAIADLIEAETSAQKRQALQQMHGDFSKLCLSLRQRLIEARAHIEAYIDFPDEDLPPDVQKKIEDDLATLENQIQKLLDDGKRGERIRDGIYGAILGVPNAGKSSLLNILAKRDVAIVSEQPGTTRDVIEVHLNIGGYPVILADTAGIRETENIIEAEGIRRARARGDMADFRIWVLDNTKPLKNQLDVAKKLTPDDVLILNKTDILPQNIGHIPDSNPISLSCITQSGVPELIERLKTLIENKFQISGNDVALTRERHRISFEAALQHIQNSSSVEQLELKGEELRRASDEIGKVIGVIHTEDVLDSLFQTFCIGK